MAVQGEGAQGKTADTGVKASDGNVYWFDSNPPHQNFLKNFKKVLTNQSKCGIINIEIKERGNENGKSKYGNYVQ